jgi:integrase
MHADDQLPINLWMRWWRADRRAESTLAIYVAELSNLAGRIEGPLIELDRLAVEDFVMSRSADGVATGRMAYRACHSFFAWAASRDIVDTDPTEKIPTPREHVNPTPPTATPGDIKQLLSAIGDADDLAIRDAAFISVAWATGCRRGELLRMQIEHVDLDEGTILLPITKTNRPRIVVLTPGATDRLVRWLEVRYRWSPTSADVWLSRASDGCGTIPLTANGARLMFERRRHAAGLDELTLHALRRGWTVHALRSGVSQVSVERLGGWRTGSPMVGKYSRSLGDELAIDEARQKLG